MARSKVAEKKAKAAYSRKYRKENKEKVLEYNRETSDERSSRNKARRKLAKKVGKRALKGKDVHHANSNPKDNSKSNLKIAKAHHEGGAKGNKNARKKKKR